LIRKKQPQKVILPIRNWLIGARAGKREVSKSTLLLESSWTVYNVFV
jgi:hypothetical protein